MKLLLARTIRIIGLTFATLFWGAVLTLLGLVVYTSIFPLVVEVGPLGAAKVSLLALGWLAIIFAGTIAFILTCVSLTGLFDWATKQVRRS